jgi:hypothetical protein
MIPNYEAGLETAPCNSGSVVHENDVLFENKEGSNNPITYEWSISSYDGGNGGVYFGYLQDPPQLRKPHKERANAHC